MTQLVGAIFLLNGTEFIKFRRSIAFLPPSFLRLILFFLLHLLSRFLSILLFSFSFSIAILSFYYVFRLRGVCDICRL